MKKTGFLSFLLALLMAVQCIPVRAAATDVVTTDSTISADSTVPTVIPQSQMAFGSVCILNGCRTVEGLMPLGGSDRRLDTAQGVFVYERKTGTVVYAYNPDMKLAPGALAKLVTALIAIERCDLDEVVTVNSRNISRLPAGSRHVDLKNEEQLTVNDLIHCLILHSGNDAAIALAEYIAGNQDAFVAMMNLRVKEMGCVNTEFGNVHGLSTASQYTTARDMTKIILEATKNKTFEELFACSEYTVPATNRSEERILRSQNYLIEQTTVPKYNHSFATGGYAGYEASVGAGIAFTADTSTKSRVGLDVVCVILGASREFASNGWTVTYYGNFDEAIDLLEFISKNFKVNRLLYEGQSMYQFSVAGGESDVVGKVMTDVDTVLPADCQMDNLIKEVSAVNGSVMAPIEKEQMIATMELWYRNSCVVEAELYAMEAVETVEDGNVTITNGLIKSETERTGFSSFVLIVCLVVLLPVTLYLGFQYYRMNIRRRRRKKRRSDRRRSY